MWSTSAGILAQVHAVAATENLLEGVPQLQAAEGVDEGVDDRVAHDENQVGVEMGRVADAVGVGGAGDDEDQVEEERCPTNHYTSLSS